MAWVSWDSMTMPKYKGGLGFKDMGIFNLALLARQAWRILQEPHSLSARILKAVYYPHSEFLESEVGSPASQVWHSISEGIEMLKVGPIKHIGNGNTTSIWNENWITCKYNNRPTCSPSDNPPVLISELMCSVTRTWNVQALNQYLLPMDAKIVRQIPVSHVDQEDFWAWSYEKSGAISVHSAYRLLVETKSRREGWHYGETGASDTDQQERNWQNLWRIIVPLKLQLFAWRLAKSLLPTTEEKQRRHITDSAACPICNATTDSWRHALLDCNMSKSVWAMREMTWWFC